MNRFWDWRQPGEWTSVNLKPKEQEIEVRVSFADTIWGCPECQQRMVIHDYEERRWRHLDSCQFKTVIIARVPVVKCPTHGTADGGGAVGGEICPFQPAV